MWRWYSVGEAPASKFRRKTAEAGPVAARVVGPRLFAGLAPGAIAATLTRGLRPLGPSGLVRFLWTTARRKGGL